MTQNPLISFHGHHEQRVARHIGPIRGCEEGQTTYTGQGSSDSEALWEMLADVRLRNPEILCGLCVRIEKEYPVLAKELSV